MNKKAFTLLELLVVVLLIGILSAVALPRFNKVMEKSRAAEPLTHIPALRNAMDRYLVKTAAGTPQGPCPTNAALLDVTLEIEPTGTEGVYVSKLFKYTFHDNCQVDITRMRGNSERYVLTFYTTGHPNGTDAAAFTKTKIICEDKDETGFCASMRL